MIQDFILKIKINKSLIKYIIFPLIILLLPLDLFIVYNFGFFGHIYPNIYINQYSVGGKTKREAARIILKSLENRTTALGLLSTYHQYTISENQIELKYDVNQTIDKAFSAGRDKQFLDNIFYRLQLIKTPQPLTLTTTFNESKLDKYVASLSAELDEPIIPPTIKIINNLGVKSASVSAGREGKLLNTEVTKRLISQAFATQKLDSIILPIEPASKSISAQQLKDTQEAADKLLDKTLILQQDSTTWQLNDEEMINFLSFYDTFDNDKIASWTARLAETVDKPAVNALFEFDGERVKEFKAAQPGKTVNQQQTLENIKKGIKDLIYSQEPQLTASIAVTLTQPEVTTEKVNNLGVKELIGKGESWFSHSIPGRVHNVALAASKLHGILVAPGETFSFVKTIGEIDAKSGYKPAYIIQNGRTILGDGGGVCQVSSTLFRAMLNAGLDITERNAHAYRVGYYEENSDPGLDATVFYPSVDLKFVNDTPAHILIQSYVDKENYYMYFELYGTKDDRKVEMTKPVIWDQIPPPPDAYQDDPSLPAGVVKQVDFKAWGAKVSFNWKVTKDNKVLREKTFYSTYRPWQAVFLRGTGGQ